MASRTFAIRSGLAGLAHRMFELNISDDSSFTSFVFSAVWKSCTTLLIAAMSSGVLS